MDSQLIDLTRYSLPNRTNLIHLYPDIPRKKSYVPFDIFDYPMLFKDERTLNIIRNGETIGCFYIESPGMRSLLKRLEVDTFEMLVIASSIIRPGVAESGMMQEFIARHKNPALRKYLVNEMELYLGETYGVMVFQEDVIKVIHYIVGLSLEEGDLLRRAMSGKTRSGEAMELLRNRFFDSCEKKKLNKEIAGELWRQISSFSGYSFCKAHSASFALLSFQVAYLKAHYPAEFMAAVLSNGGGFYSPAVYIWECKRLGLDVRLPSVNHSNYEYTGNGSVIYIGLMAVKNFSGGSAETIVEERDNNGKYVSLADFLVRTKLGEEETAVLIKCGAMDCFNETRPTLLRLLSVYINKRKIIDENYNDLFIHESFKIEEEVKTGRNYSIAQKCKQEFEIFGYMITKHPLYFFQKNISDKHIINANELNKYHGKKVRLVGWYMTSKRIRTKNGKIMKFLSLEDLTGTFEAVIFPNVYMNIAEKTLSFGPYLIEGKVDIEGGNNIIVERLDLLYYLDLKASIQKDSAEDYYTPDDEGFAEKDIYLSKINTEQLVKAYVG
jgi:DNA polymerase III alpha subunit